MRSFREQYPDVHIQVKTAFSHQVVKIFNTGDCMVAFARGGYDVSGKSELLLTEPYCLVYKELVPPESLVRYHSLNTKQMHPWRILLKLGVLNILTNPQV